MNFKKCFLIMILVLMSSSAISAKQANCSSVADEVGYKVCVSKAEKQSTLNLHALQAEILKSIEQWDEDQDYKNAAKANFLKSNIAFENYLITQCAYEGSISAGGNGKEAMMNQCKIRLNSQRIELLQSQLVKFK